MHKMNKQELSKAVATATGLSQTQASTTVAATFDSIAAALSKGETIQITGFASFSTRKTSARTGRNPKTGQSIQIPAKTKVVFKAGKALQESVN